MQSAPNPAKFMMLVLKLAFIVSGLLFIVVVARVPTQTPQQPVSPAFEWVITILAIADDIVGLCGRGLFRWIAKHTSPNGQASAPLRVWMTGNVFSLALMQSCILFGMVLHFVGARVRLVELLFAVGMISLVLWSPGTPPAAKQETPFQV